MKLTFIFIIPIKCGIQFIGSIYIFVFLQQCLLAVCISLSYFNIGLVRGYSATAFPSMRQLQPDVLLPNARISSWAGSIAPCGAFFGALLAGPLLHFIGRKRTVCIASPVGAGAWLLVGFSPNWPCLLVGRWLCGACVGLCLPSAQIYVTECTDARIRGVVGSFPSIAMSFGILVSYVLGCFLPWNRLAWLGAGVAISLSLAVGLLPESPTWLLGTRRPRQRQAQRSQKWLKLGRSDGDDGSNAKASQLLMPMTTMNKDMLRSDDVKNLPQNDDDDVVSNPHAWSVLLSRPVLQPFGIGLMLLVIQQFSGIDAVIFFTVDIFRSSGSTIDGNLATIIVGALQLGSNIASLFLVDRAGRKPLLIGSAAVMSAAMAMMGVAFYLNGAGIAGYGSERLKSQNSVFRFILRSFSCINCRFLPLVSLTIFIVGFSCGFGSVPFLLMGELLPPAQRSLLSSVAGAFNLAAMFFVIKTYHPLEAAITTAGTFWAYSVLCALGCVFVVAFVPETKGRDADEIASLFRSQKHRPMERICTGAKSVA